MADPPLEREDVQGLVLRGYGDLRAARYLLGTITDPAAARAWLGTLAGEVTDGATRPGEQAVNVAFTASGLDRLGLPDRTLRDFSQEFVDGMTAGNRSRLLGDVEESAPERWAWGGPGGERVDVLVLVFARDEPALARVVARQEAALRAGGIAPVAALETSELERREHFGFSDGISQPRIEALDPRRAPDTVKTGEFLLGHRNEYGRFTPRPRLDPADDPAGLLASDAEGSGLRDLGRNGAYLVLRQLGQDVHGFWRFCEDATRRPDGSVDEAARLRLAAKVVGRWPSGAPMALAPDADDPALADANDFGYFHVDPHGLRCPLGAHVRRANPRDSLDPWPGTERSTAVNRRHRLLRRGRKYGSLVAQRSLLTAGVERAWSEEDRGLHFICLVANLSRQFEFVQHTWLENPRFNGLYEDPDPLLSPSTRRGRTFTEQAEPVRRRHTGLPRFVTVRGGAYFFLPSLRALRHLAAARSVPERALTGRTDAT